MSVLNRPHRALGPITRNVRKEDNTRPRLKRSAPFTEGVQRMPASWKARNIQLEEIPVAARLSLTTMPTYDTCIESLQGSDETGK